jgi:hypothetical protein
MSRARRYRIVSILAVVMAGGFVALTACSNYGEGDRCETGNNNDDCVDGLQCIPNEQLPLAYRSSDRCCPPDRTRATHPACQIPQVVVGGDATPPPDTGPTPDATPADAAEASTPAEAGPDADAADEGG